MNNPRNLSSLLQEFFTEYLINQRQASGHTVASYRDAFCLLLGYAQQRLRKPPVAMQLPDLDACLISEFLTHLEKDRGASARSRNQRLGAVRSFFRFISVYMPEQMRLIQQVLAIPSKRHEKRLVTFLNPSEVDSLLRAPDRSSWIGRRDYALLMLMVQTGLRVSEVTGLCWRDVVLGPGAHVRCTGKGRKERCTPLTKEMVQVLRAWSKESASEPSEILFRTTRGGRLSTDAVQYLVRKHGAAARHTSPSLQSKRLSPHALRHTAAVRMLEGGIDRSMIALWLGHESVETTQIYLEADIGMKEKVLRKLTPFRAYTGRYVPDDALLGFLKAL